MPNTLKIFLINLSALTLFACGGGGGSSSTETPEPTLAGLESCTPTSADQTLVCGKAVAADGVTPLIGAEVTLESANLKVKKNGLSTAGVADNDRCLTDSRGEFACVIPDEFGGEATFAISADGFTVSTFQVTLSSGAATAASLQVLAANNSTQWVVVPGAFDGVQVLLSQLKGCILNDSAGNAWDYTNTNSEDARGSADCESKGLLVLDDSSDIPAFLTSNNLNNYDALFVNCSANYSFASGVNDAVRAFNDMGKHIYFSDLSDNWLSASFPDNINFAGNDTTTGTLQGSVVDNGLSSVIGNGVELIFDLGVWTAIDSVAASTTTYIEADLSPISSYTGIRPVTVGFKQSISSGCVFYTSYHIEGASSGSDQELAIKYLIQNIASVCQESV